jgi:DNA polymerase III delta prime subunit
MAIKKPWCEAYRPHQISEIIFGDDRTKRIFEKYQADKSFPNLLIYGPPGTGKSSLSGALVHDCEVDGFDVLRINCSDEKIDALRDKVKAFATTMPYGDFKVVRLEELDYLSQDGQALLRSLIEEVSGTCRFIGTCNYLNKVLPPLQDRFQLHHFAAPDAGEMALRAAEILEKREVEFTVDGLDAVIAAAYPSMRKVLQLLESHSTNGSLVLAGAQEGGSDWKIGLLPLLEKGDLKGARKLVCESASREEVVDVFRYLYDNLHKIKTLKGKDDQAVVLIAQYQDMHTRASDVEINVAALFCELGAL